MIPLDTVVTTEYQSGPDPVNHFNGYNTALVLGAAAPGYSSGQALEALIVRAKRCWFRKVMQSTGAIFRFRSDGWEASPASLPSVS